MDGDDQDERFVCAGCIGEPVLSGRIISSCGDHECAFCGHVAPALTVEELADAVEKAFETHYHRTTNEPDAFESAMLADRESSYEFERTGEEAVWAIVGAADVSEVIAQEVLEILGDRHDDFDSAAMGEECEFGAESHYEQRGPNDMEFQLEWRSFERSLKTETRYFNKEAEAFLGRLFDGIDAFRTRDGRDVVRLAGPGTDLECFYRARVFHSDDQLRAALEQPVRELGPPPSAGAVAGRMNAQGVSLFYGATDSMAALAEVRPPVGSRALVGQFDATRPLRLLDIDALRSVYVEGSVFDPGYMASLELAKFLKSLSRRMTMPVMPGDEPSEYLVTQVIADYLASSISLDLDGILYPSVQRAGEHQNVVLFRRASRVAPVLLPPGTDVEVRLEQHDEDGWAPDYCVSETVVPPGPPPPAPTLPHWAAPTVGDPFAEPQDRRKPALDLALGTLRVHHVESIKMGTEEHSVTRYRFEFRPGLSLDL